MKLDQLQTPCALVDLDRLDAGTAAMSRRVTELGGELRPHVKTHKCLEAARYQVRGHFGGITVSTFGEARSFAAGGFEDITLAFPLTHPRMDEAFELSERIESFGVLCDQEEIIEELEGREQPMKLWIEIDCGDHRGGVLPEEKRLFPLIERALNSRHLVFAGLLTHAGHSYATHNREELLRVARQEVETLATLKARLEAAGLESRRLSVGSTPTASVLDDLQGVEEMRPGNYAFYDLSQVDLQSCTLDDVAFTVLTTVAGRYPEQGRLILDAGALAIGKDPGATHLRPQGGYGLLMSADGSTTYPEMKLETLSQEHGHVVSRGDPDEVASFEIGQKLRIVPNHSCLTAALYNEYAVLRGDEVVEKWKPLRGW